MLLGHVGRKGKEGGYSDSGCGGRERKGSKSKAEDGENDAKGNGSGTTERGFLTKEAEELAGKLRWVGVALGRGVERKEGEGKN